MCDGQQVLPFVAIGQRVFNRESTPVIRIDVATEELSAGSRHTVKCATSAEHGEIPDCRRSQFFERLRAGQPIFYFI